MDAQSGTVPVSTALYYPQSNTVKLYLKKPSQTLFYRNYCVVNTNHVLYTDGSVYSGGTAYITEEASCPVDAVSVQQVVLTANGERLFDATNHNNITVLAKIVNSSTAEYSAVTVKAVLEGRESVVLGETTVPLGMVQTKTVVITTNDYLLKWYDKIKIELSLLNN